MQDEVADKRKQKRLEASLFKATEAAVALNREYADDSSLVAGSEQFHGHVRKGDIEKGRLERRENYKNALRSIVEDLAIAGHDYSARFRFLREYLIVHNKPPR